jgi:DNA-directed RNA polymerase specialized sigma24 family protein
MIAAMSMSEVLAITRLRQWSVDRAALRASRTTEYRREGWQNRNNRSYDSRLVRSIDFERALGKLTYEEQMVLTLTYRERHREKEVSKIMACSERKVSYLLPAARKRLAEVLDRMDLL